MSRRRWCFIAGRPFLPELDDPFAAGLGGTEQAIIHLTGALADLGDAVTVVGAKTTRTLRGVAWRPDVIEPADITVAINDARLLPPGAPKPVIWFHNEVGLSREIRRGRALALMRSRAIAVFIGTEQARAASRLLPFARRRVVIPYGLSDRVLCAPTAAAPPPPVALFTSQAYRGLKEVLAFWQAQVAPAVPGAALRAFIAEGDVHAYRALAGDANVTITARVGNDAVLTQLQNTRVLLAPGHVSETFCLAAAEAIALGVPVVTLGLGSLKERVRDGVDGFICKDYAEMALRTRELLSNHALWLRMQAAGISTRAGRDWHSVAGKWQSESCRPTEERSFDAEAGFR